MTIDAAVERLIGWLLCRVGLHDYGHRHWRTVKRTPHLAFDQMVRTCRRCGRWQMIPESADPGDDQ